MTPNKFWDKDGKRTIEYRDSLLNQTRLWMQGIPVHNTFSDECTPDFSCCQPDMMTPNPKRQEWGKRILLQFGDATN